MERNLWKIVFILIFIFSFFGISADISQKYRREFEETEDVLILGLQNGNLLNKTVHPVGSHVIDSKGYSRYKIPTASVQIQPKNLYAVADLKLLVEKEKYKKPVMTSYRIYAEEIERGNVKVAIPAEVTIKIEPDYRKNQIIGKIQTVPKDAFKELQGNRIIISKDNLKNLETKQKLICKDPRVRIHSLETNVELNELYGFVLEDLKDDKAAVLLDEKKDTIRGPIRVKKKNLEYVDSTKPLEDSELSFFYNCYSRGDRTFVTYVMIDDLNSKFNEKIGIITHMENENCKVEVDGKVETIETKTLILLDNIREYTSKNAFTTQTRKQILIPNGTKIQIEVTDNERIGTIQNHKRTIKGTKVFIEDKHEDSLDLNPISILEKEDYVLAYIYDPNKDEYKNKVGQVGKTCSGDPNHECLVIINGETQLQLIKRMDLIPINNIVADHGESVNMIEKFDKQRKE